MTEATGAIQGGMPVLGSDGQPLGVVDHLDGSFIKLRRSDAASGARHRWIAAALVGALQEGQVRLAVTAAEAEAAALDEDEAQRRMISDADGRREFGQPDDGGAPRRSQPPVAAAAPEPHPGRPLP